MQRAVPIREMTREQRAIWDRALAYYRQFGSSDALRDPTSVTANYELSDAGNSSSLAGRHLPPEMVIVLETAAPVYRALWWSEQDRQNQHWIDAASSLVRGNEHGPCIWVHFKRIGSRTWMEKPPLTLRLPHWSKTLDTVEKPSVAEGRSGSLSISLCCRLNG